MAFTRAIIIEPVNLRSMLAPEICSQSKVDFAIRRFDGVLSIIYINTIKF